MIRETFDNIREQVNVRENLIKLKEEMKEPQGKTALLYYIGADYQVLVELLKKDEPKVRKNAALILGELRLQEALKELYEAYIREEQLFVKSSYLTAIKNLDYSNYISELEARLEEIGGMEIKEESRKHINEELRLLSQLVLKAKGIKKHIFTGMTVPSKIILLTNRNYIDATLKQLDGITAKEFNAGVMAECEDLRPILAIRTYTEILFMLEDVRSIDADAVSGAKLLAESSLLSFLKERHEGEQPFYFRIEVKAKMELDKRSAFTKKFAAELERLTKRELINSTSDYEWELRLIENKEGRFNVLIKLYTLKDERFHYRKNVIATSIQPSMAALVAVLAKDYMKEGAQVLDPFCGVGTMLIERNRAVRAGTMYGLDTFGEAIDKAKENTSISGEIIYYINRDFFDFKHEYLFDEIFTNMPRVLGHKEEEEIYELYQKFFLKVSEHVKKGGVIIMYSHNQEYVYKFCRRSNFKLMEEYEISKKEGTYCYVLEVL